MLLSNPHVVVLAVDMGVTSISPCVAVLLLYEIDRYHPSRTYSGKRPEDRVGVVNRTVFALLRRISVQVDRARKSKEEGRPPYHSSSHNEQSPESIKVGPNNYSSLLILYESRVRAPYGNHTSHTHPAAKKL